MPKKIPIRKCIVCQTHRSKNEFFRIVHLKTPNIAAQKANIFLDKTFKSDGRGTYICKNEICLRLAKKRQSLSKAFRLKVDDKIYDQLEKNLKDLQF